MNKVVIDTEINAKKTVAGVEQIKKSISGMAKTTSEASKNFAGMFNMKMLAGALLVMKSLVFVVRQVTKAIKEGVKNLAQFNDGNNATNTALSNLKSSLTQLKNSLGSAFAPIIQWIEPALTKMIDSMSEATTKVGMFIASLTGASSFTRAVKVQEDYAKSLGKTADSAKKAKGQLAGIYDLNVVNSKTEVSNDNGTAKPNEMFETVAIENNISAFVDRIKSILSPLVNDITTWFSNDAVPAYFNFFASTIDLCRNAFELLRPSLEYLWNNVLVPMGKFIGDVWIKVVQDLTDGVNYFTKMLSEHSEEIQTALDAISKAFEATWLVGKGVIQFFVGMLKPFLTMVINVVGHIIDVLSGLIKFIQGVFTGDWKLAWEGIVKIFKGIWNVLLDVVEGVLNMIIGGLNFINIDVPDWVPLIGGKHFGFNFQEVHFPRLASGTVVPRQSSEFMAILGDNNREAEVVSPLSTMKQAMLEALNESGVAGSGSVNVNVYLEGDAQGLFHLVRTEEERYFDANGEMVFVH